MAMAMMAYHLKMTSKEMICKMKVKCFGNQKYLYVLVKVSKLAMTTFFKEH